MNKKFLVVIGVTLLFLGISVQPCIAVVQKEVMKEPTVAQGDYNYLANLSMDFGEYIYNNRIEYEEIYKRPPGNWTVNVKIKFRCPENIKIVVRYSYSALLHDYHLGESIDFCDAKKTVTIINGSNPPDINKNYTQEVQDRGREYHLILIISANLTAYEYLDEEWVKIHNDEIYNETTDWIQFNRIRTSERTQILMRLFERFANMEVLLRIMKLLR